MKLHSPGGGGLIWPPPPLISATEHATAAKFCTNIEVNVLYKIASLNVSYNIILYL